MILLTICTELCYQRRTTHQPNKQRPTQKHKMDWKNWNRLQDTQAWSKPFSDAEESRLHPNIPTSERCVGYRSQTNTYQGGKQDQHIAYYSRKLLDHDKKYSMIEKECLAILLEVKAFTTNLLGKPFTLETNNWALTWLQTFKDKNAHLTRWSLALQPYTFQMQHWKGRENANTNALSHLLCGEGNYLCFALEKKGRNVEDQCYHTNAHGDHVPTICQTHFERSKQWTKIEDHQREKNKCASWPIRMRL